MKTKSLGPANDLPVAVVMELEAAEIAAGDRIASPYRADGMRAFILDQDYLPCVPDLDGGLPFWVGWLAAAITLHTQERVAQQLAELTERVHRSLAKAKRTRVRTAYQLATSRNVR